LPDGLLQRIKLAATPWVYRGLTGSLRFRPPHVLEASPPAPAVFACLHRDMLLAIPFVAPARPALLVSRSDDGEILTRTLLREGFRVVRGSTGKEGGPAFRGLLDALAADVSVGIAVDGPRGPFGRIHEGVVRLAARSGAPIVPLVARPGRHLQLRTWDRTVIPAPFSRVGMTVGEPLRVGERPGDQADALAALRAFLLAGEGGAP